jgi:predicted acyl esterase
VLTFTGPALEKNLEIMGAMRLVLYVHSSQAYTDFIARVCDVHPVGVCQSRWHLLTARAGKPNRRRPAHRNRLWAATGPTVRAAAYLCSANHVGTATWVG